MSKYVAHKRSVEYSWSRTSTAVRIRASSKTADVINENVMYGNSTEPRVKESLVPRYKL